MPHMTQTLIKDDIAYEFKEIQRYSWIDAAYELRKKDVLEKILRVNEYQYSCTLSPILQGKWISMKKYSFSYSSG